MGWLHYSSDGGIRSTEASASTFVQPQVRVFNSAVQSIPNTTLTAHTFNSERWDTDSIHSTVSNTSRLTAVTSGLYDINGTIEFASNAIGHRQIAIKLNNITFISSHTTNALSTLSTNLAISTIYQLAAGDYVELFVAQTSGGPLNTSVVGNSSPEFMMTRVSA